MRIALTGTLAFSTGLFHYHEYTFTRDEVCPTRWGRSHIISLAQPGLLRLGFMSILYGPTLASDSDKLNEFHLPTPYVLVILAQEPDAVEAAKAIAWTRSEQRSRIICINETMVAECLDTPDGFEILEHAHQPMNEGYGVPFGLVPMALPAKAAPAKPPAPKKKPKAEVVETPIEAEPPSVPPEPETAPVE